MMRDETRQWSDFSEDANLSNEIRVIYHCGEVFMEIDQNAYLIYLGNYRIKNFSFKRSKYNGLVFHRIGNEALSREH